MCSWEQWEAPELQEGRNGGIVASRLQRRLGLDFPSRLRIIPQLSGSESSAARAAEGELARSSTWPCSCSLAGSVGGERDLYMVCARTGSYRAWASDTELPL